MPSIECRDPSRPASAECRLTAPNSEITPSMSTISSGLVDAAGGLCGFVRTGLSGGP